MRLRPTLLALAVSLAAAGTSAAAQTATPAAPAAPAAHTALPRAAVLGGLQRLLADLQLRWAEHL